jgi:hypothetical protein
MVRDDLWGIERAAEYLSVTVSWLRKRATVSGPAYFKIGRKRYYAQRDLDAYVSKCRHDPLAGRSVAWDSTDAAEAHSGITVSRTGAKSTVDRQARPTSGQLHKRRAAYGLP